MEPSSDDYEDGAVRFDLAGKARVSGYEKGVVMESDDRISRVLANGENDMRLNGEVSRSALVDSGNLGTNLVESRSDRNVSEVAKLHAINLVVDLSQCSTKEANVAELTEKDLTVASFKPAKTIQCVQDLAKDPFGMNPLDFSTIEAQLSAFNLWKGHYKLHINELDNNPNYVNSDGITKTGKGNDHSQKRKHVFDGDSSPIKKVKSLTDLMSKGRPSVSDVEYTPIKRGRKRKNLEFNRDEFLSHICMAARNPIEKQHHLDSLVRFSSDFRNYRMETKLSGIKEIEIQPDVNEEHGFSGITDSYWTDRIIEFNPKKENSATALILKFTDLESVPSVKQLNEIFGRFGHLQEDETKVLKKKKCVKMVFERRCDAESAFSSSGKFSIFGPSLVSYCLNFSPTPQKKRDSWQKSKQEGCEIG